MCLALAAALAAASAPDSAMAAGAPDFGRDILPILSENCFKCHGPDPGTRKGGLRLDAKEGALRGEDAVIVPGRAVESELILRIKSDDPDEVMPPPKAHRTLSPRQVDLLTRWIDAGAPWGTHWAFAPPRRPELPPVRDARRPRSPVDRFLLARLDAEGLTPAPEADRTTLIRRLSFDLTGLPPTPEEVDAFRDDARPDAFERLVERLLGSPHYGERMAMEWLDLVRYADTVGYHSDVGRSISAYRDYVIRAFNEDMPFDRFTIEQIAGDLLPNPTAWQRVASGYNMLGMTTEEGGAQAKEYLARYAADRVRNAGSVWLGATLGCAECHDHKYDPYSARDFYAFAAFFADLQQPGVGTPKPTLMLPTAEQSSESARLAAQLEEIEAAIAAEPDDPGCKELEERRDAVKKARGRLDRAIRKTVVAVPGPPRVTRVLHRGDWMDETGAVVAPGVPSFLKALDVPPDRRADRLDLARWLVAPDHPLTARVVVNRLWKRFFGTGLSDTLDDLGAQGERPIHPELLDWLAVEFREGGWDLKQMVRLIVTSAAYRQSSTPRAELSAIDPGNRLYARQSSPRLEAELIRDNALAVSGLLNPAVGGESVRPYQPDGYWRFLNFPKRQYTPSRGPDQYRRGLYTHWQRTLLHPALLAFDAPSRELCTARRPISNTPQAALTLLNDPCSVEAARALASLTLREADPCDDCRLGWIWRRVLSRELKGDERAILSALLARHRAAYADDPGAARELLGVGQSPAEAADPPELAAWTSVARVLLNLDETITRD
jgi:hypothetical protein